MDSNIISSFFTADFVFVVIRVGVPLLFAAMSAYIAALAGISNIAVEGIMIFGALFGVYFSAITGSAWGGLAGVVAIGILCALVIAFFTMKMKANPIMIGIALNLFAADISIWLLLVWTGSKGTTASLPSKVLPTVNIPFLENIPILGEILSGHYFLTYVCIVLAILLAILVYKTPLGLHMKACGLDAHAAESVGIKVNRVRLIAIILSGIFAALGGAYLSMGYMSIFSNNMTASRGWIGIAAQAVGQGNFLIVVITTAVFAFAQGIVNRLALTTLPAELINTIPYIFVLIGLIGLSINEYRKAKSH
ncbi:MAG: ABC transporter permease [Erysipelotrichales bacterium]|nr:ABC transporter permease [Erysipelotrichales bacterium]MBR3693363.1 ABC transporter permease [Erysipelotrichales bacterium]